MGLFTTSIECLQQGKAVPLTVTGGQLAPKVPVGTILTLSPVNDDTTLKPGDIVLCRVDDRDRLLLVKSISVGRVKLGTPTKPLDGWASRASIFGYARGVG
jgi:hypothetical protein